MELPPEPEHGSRQNHGRVHHRETAIDVLAEAARANRSSNRRGADADDGRDADAGDNRRQRQRQLHLPQQLARGHPHRDAGLANRRVDPAESGDRCPHDWEQPVQNQHDERRARADAADERHGEEKAEHRQAWDGLHDAGDGHQRRRQARAPRREDAERDAERDRDECGSRDEQHVLAEQARELGAVR